MIKYLLIFLFAVSLMWNACFMYQKIKKDVGNAVLRSKEEPKKYFSEKLFSDDFSLKDYSATKFSLEQEGKDIIKNAREFHSSPAIVKWDAYDEYVCAGYIFGLSKILWDDSAPYMIGMMEQNTKTPADAWQLPYSYEYVGGKILSDFTWDFSINDKDYWKKIDILKLKNFFGIAFSEEALLWDIGFFYKQTWFTQDLKTYQNSNSHIVKNIWTSEFIRKINNPTGKSQDEVISHALSCDADIYLQIKNFLTNYEIYLDSQRIVLHKDDFYYLWEDNTIEEKVVFTDMSELSFKDITLMHFFEWAKVESLFEMTCQWEFFPVNIMQINPRFIEKM